MASCRAVKFRRSHAGNIHRLFRAGFLISYKRKQPRCKEIQPSAEDTSRLETRFSAPWNHVPINIPYDLKMTQSFMKRLLFSPLLFKHSEKSTEIKLYCNRASKNCMLINCQNIFWYTPHLWISSLFKKNAQSSELMQSPVGWENENIYLF